MITNVICFDDTFPGFVREKTGSTDLLFVPSWDWWGIKHAHTDLSEFRAVENGFSLVKPTYGGISTAVDGQGHVIRRFDTADTGFDTVQFADVPATRIPTVYARYGGIIDLAFCLSGFVTVALGVYLLGGKGRRKHRSVIELTSFHWCTFCVSYYTLVYFWELTDIVKTSFVYHGKRGFCIICAHYHTAFECQEAVCPGAFRSAVLHSRPE